MCMLPLTSRVLLQSHDFSHDQALEQENEELRDLSLRQTWDTSGVALAGSVELQ